MTVRAPVSDLSEGERVLAEPVSRYLCRVLRLGPADRFVAFDPEARTEADAVLVDAAIPTRVRIEAVRPAKVVASAALVLIYALAKGDKVDDVVRDATELGATRIIVAKTARTVVKASAERLTGKHERWQRIAEQAARQCGRSDPPAIEGVFEWAEALDRAACDAQFCLHPGADIHLGDALTQARGGSIAFAIGPEGGLTPDEVALAESKGFVAASLGPFVLRTETVAAAVLGAVRILSR